MNIQKYHKGDVLTLLPLNEPVTVIHSTLKGGGVNAEEAVVFVETQDGFPVAVPVAVQDRYLTTDPPKKVPVTGNQIKPKPGMIGRIFGAFQRDVKK